MHACSGQARTSADECSNIRTAQRGGQPAWQSPFTSCTRSMWRAVAMIHAVDSQSSNDPKSPNYNGDCKVGIRVGSVKDGKVKAYIPLPPVSD